MYGTEEICYLQYQEPWQLLVATILSAQCTDARVNMVTPALFVQYPTVESMAEAKLPELEEAIRSTGFYHNKAKNIIGCCRGIVEQFGGVVPCDIEELTRLPGVGRKTANVLRTHVYHEPSVVVDTHVKRISNRLGLTTSRDPVKIEQDLMKELPKDHWSLWNFQIIAFGRSICKAQRPVCEGCRLKKYCNYGK